MARYQRRAFLSSTAMVECVIRKGQHQFTPVTVFGASSRSLSHLYGLRLRAAALRGNLRRVRSATASVNWKNHS
jgi:hypothetical protein